MPEKVAYEFGGFRFEPANARLLYGTAVIPLTLKAAETLAVLVTRPNVLISKEELMAAVWPDTAVEENNLNQQISVLRKALTQNGDGQFIETVPRRGYRFVGRVRAVVVEPEGPAITASPETEARPVPIVAPASRGRPFGRAAAIAALALAIAAAGVAGWNAYQRQRVEGASRALMERGDELMREGNPGAAARAYQDAISVSPRNADAFAALAHALHKQSTQGGAPRVGGQSPSVAAAARAVSLDPQCAGCRGTLGMYLFYHDWAWAKAEAQFKEAIRLDPNRESVRPPYAMLLAATGRPGLALEQIDFALERQPFFLTWQGIRTTVLYVHRRYADAIAAADRALALKSDDRATWDWRGKAAYQLGRRDEAIDNFARSFVAERRDEVVRIAAEQGFAAALNALLQSTESSQESLRWRRAWSYALLNEDDLALAELEHACQYRNINLLYVGVDPAFDRLRNHPRFRKILATMGLESTVDGPLDEVARRQNR
jgi:DNA-binding winged helix-turn-helix (wHTH) protein/Tfp pilus assembly protein PilF